MVQFFKLLIENKSFSLNAQDEKGMSPLHYAAVKNNYRAALLLLHSPGINIHVNLNVIN